FGHVGAGRIRVDIGRRYSLEEAVTAHRDMESGAIIGQSIFAL
ncbi:zinc-binding dehydrogenase, partial [Staphylococcus capitis]|nr:zinc-binding dehydrogenase [Staphylococcus capitis]